MCLVSVYGIQLNSVCDDCLALPIVNSGSSRTVDILPGGETPFTKSSRNPGERVRKRPVGLRPVRPGFGTLVAE